LIPKPLPFGFKFVERVRFAALTHRTARLWSSGAKSRDPDAQRLKRFPEIPRLTLGMKLLLATHNSNKTREFAQLLGVEFCIRDLTALRDLLEIAETGRSFEENAAIKATAVSKLCPDQVVIADDSGLEVDALEGAPGVFFA